MMRFWKRYVAAVIINIVLVIIVLAVRGFDLKIYYVDAFSVAGAVSIFLGLLIWAADAGAFDTIGYGFSTLGTKRRDKNLYEYTLRKKEKRSRQGKTFIPHIIVGAIFLLISFIINFCKI